MTDTMTVPPTPSGITTIKCYPTLWDHMKDSSKDTFFKAADWSAEIATSAGSATKSGFFNAVDWTATNGSDLANYVMSLF